jgi:hypothetical protein
MGVEIGHRPLAGIPCGGAAGRELPQRGMQCDDILCGSGTADLQAGRDSTP